MREPRPRTCEQTWRRRHRHTVGRKVRVASSGQDVPLPYPASAGQGRVGAMRTARTLGGKGGQARLSRRVSLSPTSLSRARARALSSVRSRGASPYGYVLCAVLKRKDARGGVKRKVKGVNAGAQQACTAAATATAGWWIAMRTLVPGRACCSEA